MNRGRGHPLRALMVGCTLTLMAACAGGSADGADPGATLWSLTLGVDAHTEAKGVAADGAGGAFVVGFTRGDLEPGDGRVGGLGPASGGSRGFVARVGPQGDVLWSQRIEGDGRTHAESVATDAAGAAIVVGHALVYGAGDDTGSLEAFVRRYGPGGELTWSDTFGGGRDHEPTGVAVDAVGRVWIVGSTDGGDGDAFVRTYEPDGTLAWAQVVGTGLPNQATAVAVDAAGNGIVVGLTAGDLGGATGGWTDAFVRKVGPSGVEIWTRQFGSGDPNAFYAPALGVAVDAAGDVIVSGKIDVGLGTGASHLGSFDAFVRKYDASGYHGWTRQFGTEDWDEGHALAVDAQGRIYIAGHTAGALPGFASEGETDAFVRAFTAGGEVTWTRQLVTGSGERAFGVALVAADALVVAGSSYADTSANPIAVAFVVALRR